MIENIFENMFKKNFEIFFFNLEKKSLEKIFGTKLLIKKMYNLSVPHYYCLASTSQQEQGEREEVIRAENRY